MQLWYQLPTLIFPSSGSDLHISPQESVTSWQRNLTDKLFGIRHMEVPFSV